ncbi:MAG: TIM barrel protein [Chloroflexota bacterium]
MAAAAAVDLPATALAIDRVAWAVDGLNIEIPSWGFVNTGTRFRVFPQQGVPRTVFEKLDDAATVNRYTGIARTVSLHIPWDKVDDWAELKAHADAVGLRFGGINSNTFQDLDYKLGSVCHPDAVVRSKAVGAIVECNEIASVLDAQAVKVWLGDGTNYPGQDDLRGRHRRLLAGLRGGLRHAPRGHAPVPRVQALRARPVPPPSDRDWGQALNATRQLGDRAGVCVDTGHHAMGVNIEQIVALLIAEGKLFAFDLNDKKYGDDDLMVGSIDPYQLFRIAHELVNAMRDGEDAVAQRTANDTVYMLDQCHNIEPKVPAMIRSVMNLQETIAKALLVDRERLTAAQAAGDVLEANSCLWDAFNTDVRPLLAQLRVARGLPADPYRAYLASGEEERKYAARVGGTAASW